MRSPKVSSTVMFLLFALAACAAPCAAATLPLQGDALQAYTLKDGRVITAGSALESMAGPSSMAEVNEVPAAIGGKIRYWTVLDSEFSDQVKEEETGVWFFSAEGVALRHAPLESAYEFQGVSFSPDGSAFVIHSGSGIRPDIFFQVYGQAPEMLAEVAGVRNAVTDGVWVDASRFVLTRINDTRTEPNYENPEKNNSGKTYGWRTSVVLFDALANETVVLKESTATQNFWFYETVEGGKAVEGWEQYVASESDWGDADKEQTRDFRIEIASAQSGTAISETEIQVDEATLKPGAF